MTTNLVHWLASQAAEYRKDPGWKPEELDFVRIIHPDYRGIRGEDWSEKARREFDPTPPFLDETDPAELVRTAWRWSKRAWTALLAPQLERVRTRTIRETEPFTFGYFSGAASALVDFLQVGENRWLSGSIIVGVHADVFGEEALYEAHQLCSSIAEAGDTWPSSSRLNNFETGWKAGYIEMVDLLSRKRPDGLLGRFLCEELEPDEPLDLDIEVIVAPPHSVIEVIVEDEIYEEAAL